MAGGLRYQYARLSIAEKLIAINVLFFIVFGLLTRMGFPRIESWFSLSGNAVENITKPWSLISYSFLHSGIWHLAWNMYILFISGKILLNIFDGKRFMNVYFLGVIFGGLFYLLTDTLFIHTNGMLIGASAGVIAVLIFVCTYIPMQEVRIIFFNVKLWQVGLFVVLIDLLQISSGGGNLGGRIAHLGGALLGYMYARQLVHGRDIGAGFSKLIDGLVNAFTPSKRKAPMKTVYKNQKTSKGSTAKYEKDLYQKKIDAILDKISKSGYESLTKAEKDFLFKAGKKE